MAHKKSGGATRQHMNRAGKRLGVKLYAGETVEIGGIIIRQRGTKTIPGENVKAGRDHTLYATKAGTVDFKRKHERVIAYVK